MRRTVEGVSYTPADPFPDGEVLVLLTQTASLSYETPVAALVVIAPSQASAGGAVSLTVRAVDAQGVVVRSYRGTVRLDSTDPEASFVDSTIDLGPADAGAKTVPNVGFFRSAGTFRIQAVDTARPAIEGESGDVAVAPGTPAQLRAVFGDSQSGDAGTWLPDPLRAHLEDAFGNAIPDVDLVFAALTGNEAISTTFQGATSTSLTVRTDSLGEAEVFVRLDATPQTNEVEVRFGALTPVRFTLSGTGVVVPDAIAIAAVSPVAIGGESEVTVTLTAAGTGVPGKLGSLTLASDNAGDALSAIEDNGDGTSCGQETQPGWNDGLSCGDSTTYGWLSAHRAHAGARRMDACGIASEAFSTHTTASGEGDTRAVAGTHVSGVISATNLCAWREIHHEEPGA